MFLWIGCQGRCGAQEPPAIGGVRDKGWPELCWVWASTWAEDRATVGTDPSADPGTAYPGWWGGRAAPLL